MIAVPEWLRPATSSMKPPPKLTGSQWADSHYYLSAETSAEPGKWRTRPYQREIMDAMTDRRIRQVTWQKSSRVGATLMLCSTVGYHIDQDPSPILAIEPTLADASDLSKSYIANMLEECPVLRNRVLNQGSKKSEQTILSKQFRGGAILSMAGANSPTGLRRISRRVIMFDEVSAFPTSAGSEGDPVSLAQKRAADFHDRKFIYVSTPLVEGICRISKLYQAGDQRRYHVPCTTCGHMDYLVFRRPKKDSAENEKNDKPGHWMRWPHDRPDLAHFVCSKNGCEIRQSKKFEIVSNGKWIAEKPFDGHASFHIWSGYSLSSAASWPEIAKAFIDANGSVTKLQVFVNTDLGETWKDRGDVPDWEKLYARRETYAVGSVPDGVRFITAGVDVQKDRFVYEVVGWDYDKRSWSIDAGELHGPTALATTWDQLDELLERSYMQNGVVLKIRTLAIDSGAFTNTVYNWARHYPTSRVIACKGTSAHALIGLATPVEVDIDGTRHQNAYKVWPIGQDVAKDELYGWLQLRRPSEETEKPDGWCHFPEYAEEFFKQLTGEQLVTKINKHGFPVMAWEIIPGHQNHFLDARILARCAASLLGLDRIGAVKDVKKPSAKPTDKTKTPTWITKARQGAKGSGRGSWVKRRR